MNLKDKLIKMIPQFQDDGSREVAQQYLDLLRKNDELRVLKESVGFQGVLSQMKSDFIDRMRIVVKDDPELNEIRKMFIRTMGNDNADAEIEKHLAGFLENENEL